MDSPVLTSVVMPAAIAVIMCSLGMTLTPADFRRVLVAPRGVAIGMLSRCRRRGPQRRRDVGQLRDLQAGPATGGGFAWAMSRRNAGSERTVSESRGAQNDVAPSGSRISSRSTT